MTYSKLIVNEILKTLFLTIALFALFDIVSHGYSNYHNWVVTFYLASFSLYYPLAKRYL
ncbi:hypothetical protein ACLKMH_02760 [Psychromonas sp. KJ10-10]|uniref:hypothetical protein n=1 Tax=Psychromonas sp. KJ10-10 TaxID=3391823 RepID=UPI0039B58BF2